ncbi:MAG: thiamine diphosphokinase [Candidatus Kryptoniota bacterium]
MVNLNIPDRILVFCNGTPPSRERVARLIPAPSLVACADGGTDKALNLGYVPQLVVGDFDSISPSAKKSLKNAELIQIDSQENTDFEKILNVLIERGITKLSVTAFSGGRLSQTLANMQTAFKYSDILQLVLFDESSIVYPVRQSLILSLPPATTVSLLPATTEAYVSTEGLLYRLERSLLSQGGRGVSNISVSNTVSIKVHDGGLYVILEI